MIFFEKIQLFCEGFTEGFKEGWHEAGTPKAVSGNSDDGGCYYNEDSSEEVSPSTFSFFPDYDDIYSPSHEDWHPYHPVHSESNSISEW